MTITSIKTIYWIVIAAMSGYFALTGVLQGAFELFNAKRKGTPAEQKSAQDDIWNGVIAIAVILAIGAAIWLALSPQLTEWMSQAPSSGESGWIHGLLL